jgi:hypothetical protein
MTDTTFFTCTAINRQTGEWKKFFSLVPGRANEMAKAWLASQ